MAEITYVFFFFQASCTHNYENPVTATGLPTPKQGSSIILCAVLLIGHRMPAPRHPASNGYIIFTVTLQGPRKYRLCQHAREHLRDEQAGQKEN